jgi:hypothetical protein
LYWTNSSNESPAVGTIITWQDIASSAWQIADSPGPNRRHALQLEQLQRLLHEHEHEHERGKTGFVIQPSHCRVGSGGAAVPASLQRALTQWAGLHHDHVQYISPTLDTAKHSDSAGANMQHAHYRLDLAEKIAADDKVVT